MSEKSICILCEKEAGKSHIQGRDGDLIECETCGRYFLASPEIFKGCYTKKMPREKRAMLSAYTRDMSECGKEFPELGDPDELEETIAKYENKTEDEKIKNLIWYVRKKSREYDDKVPWDAEKDYPITYSYGSEGFEKIRKKARDDMGFLQYPARGIELRLTEEGYKLGTKLLEDKK